MPKVETFRESNIKPIVRNTAIPQVNIKKADLTIVRAAENLANVAIREYSNYEDSKAEQAMTLFKKQENDLLFLNEDAYFNSKGENAYKGEQGINESLVKLRNNISNDLNPLAREKFMRGSQAHLQNSKLSINKHAQKGLEVFDSETRKATISNTFESATLNWNNPDQVAQQNTLGKLAIIDNAEKEGIGQVALKEELEGYDSVYYSGVIKAAADVDLTEANKLMDKWDKKFESSEDKKKVQDYIDRQQKTVDVKNNAHEVLSRATEIRNTAGRDLRFGMSLIEKVEPKYQAKVRREYFSQVAAQNRIEAKDNKDTINDAKKHVNQGGSMDQWIAIGDNFEKYNRLSETGKESLSRTGKIDTPLDLQIQISSAIANDDKDQVQSLIDQYGDNFSTKDEKKAKVFLNTDDNYRKPSLGSPIVKSVTNGMKKETKNNFNDKFLEWSRDYYEEFKKNPNEDEVRLQVKEMTREVEQGFFEPNKPLYKSDIFIQHSLRLNSLDIMEKYFPGEDTRSSNNVQSIEMFKMATGRYPGDRDFKQYKQTFEFVLEENKTTVNKEEVDSMMANFLIKKGRYPTLKDLEIGEY